MTGTIPLIFFPSPPPFFFSGGICVFFPRRNLITMLMSIELILNSVNINFVAFNRFLYPDNLHGHFFSLIVIAVAAAEAAVAIAIIINIYRNFRSIDVDKVDEMKF